ncbi:putative manganese-dependent inorganic diphosphatase [Methanomicrobium antiquum]|uniref:inorganic diphosphatase n=1 Tax=Methanomicrobium antiquum TaxID=487686 RepID=A0AAF0JNI1_9EURY|nr:putative manganese-dependent inorganic diphosphatase [Methanomicrobium antiquum]MDD3977684.1 putative manganese-dependent inorganic diphosphatase [Methanomicrobium sp.]WFN37600.1 putative manganese-dependent inorganic diphosphatase [Methanomicrobium antiquum]
MNKIYIIGHKNPDTDSVCSAIGYAHLLNIKEEKNYIPAYCGEINPETQYAMEYFNAKMPEYIETVEPNISDMPFTYTFSAEESVPTIDIISMMDEYNVRNVPVTDKDGKLTGLMSEHGLAQAYVRRQKIEQLLLTTIKLDTLTRILSAKILVPSKDLLEGKVYIAIDALHVTLSKLTHNDVAIVGDDEPAQLSLISAGIAALIIADGAPVGERVIKAAQEKKIALISTNLDAFGVGKMINLSLPASQVMAKDVPTVTKEDTIEYAKQLVSSSRYRTACVVDNNHKFLGMISRNTFLENVQKQVILVDHNEYAQAVEGIESAEILEIIDHHRLGAITTLKPISFLNEPVGSTSTIIAGKYLEENITPEPPIAGILLAGILSDTLVLRLSTTTEKDKRIVKYLSEIAGVDYNEFGTELIKKGMDTEGQDLKELLMRDIKEYNLFNRKVLISQIMIPTFDFSSENKEEIINSIKELKKQNRADIFAVLLTSVFENGSEIYINADGSILNQCGAEKQPVRMEGMMSRKNDFLPWFGQILKNN